MAIPRHLQDKDAHKSLFEVLRGEMGSAFASLSESVNGLLEPIRTATHFPDPNTIMKRDAAGRVRVADPMDAHDVATKEYVDAQGPPEEEITIFKASGVFTAKVTGLISVICVGGGGGADGHVSGKTAQNGMRGLSACGSVYVEAGKKYNVIVGAGGAGGAANSGTTTGGNGGTSTFDAPWVTCAGGAGGGYVPKVGLGADGWKPTTLTGLTAPARGFGAGGRTVQYYPGGAGGVGVVIVFSTKPKE